jgi:hypothetical protein
MADSDTSVESIMRFQILLILFAFGGTRVPAFDIVGSDPYSYVLKGYDPDLGPDRTDG